MTLLAEVVRTSSAVAATASRLEKTRLIAECLKRLDPDEVEIALPYLSGDMRQGRLALGYATLQPALGAPSDAPGLQLREVDAAFAELKSTKGKGSAASRSNLLRSLFGKATAEEQDFLLRLIVGELQAPWISYQHELPVNRALPFWLPVEEGDEIANYTRAWAQEAGWMWQIPTQFRYGCGYVYSDEFRTPDEAHAEVERVLGRKIEVRSDIQFKIGRLEKAWIGNVLAVGLSSSFLEPLESTSIHGTIVQMMMFAGNYLREPGKMTDVQRDDYNKRVGRQVDDFRTFVNTHYLVERDDTPFWREVRANRIHPETKERMDRWSREMPRLEHFPQYLFGLPHTETQLHYPVLQGLGLLDPELAKAEMARDPKLRSFAKATYDSLVREYKQAATQALGHAEFLQAIRDGATLP